MTTPHASAPTSGHDAAAQSHVREILKARARALARPVGREQSSGDMLHVVVFRLAQERYAIEQVYVREIQPLKELTPLPCTPDFVLGIINVRGQILPVIDVKRFFDLPDEGITDLHVVVIVHVDDVELGILADAVLGVRAVALDGLQPSLPTLTGIRETYLKGITDDRTAVLDAVAIATDPKLVVQDTGEISRTSP